MGAFVAAFEYATGRTATLVGKPSRAMFEAAARSMGLDVSEVAMVGDDLQADIGGSQGLGIRGLHGATGQVPGGRGRGLGDHSRPGHRLRGRAARPSARLTGVMPSPHGETAAVLDDTCILYIDGGTTRTRGWAAVGERVVAVERVTVGARDTAREGSPRRLAEALQHLFRKIGERCRAQGAARSRRSASRPG